MRRSRVPRPSITEWRSHTNALVLQLRIEAHLVMGKGGVGLVAAPPDRPGDDGFGDWAGLKEKPREKIADFGNAGDERNHPG
jgi:hypothetical protein